MKKLLVFIYLLLLYTMAKAQYPAALPSSGAISVKAISDWMLAAGEITTGTYSISTLNSLSHLTDKTAPYSLSDWYGYEIPIYANGKITKQKRPYAASGIFTIDPDGVGGNAPFQAYIDMTRDGGGWTLVFKRASGNQVDNNAQNVANLLDLNVSNGSFSAVTINAISGQSLGNEYELRLEGAYSSSLMKAFEPFYVGQINNRQITVKYDCNRDGIYEVTKVWNDWSDDRSFLPAERSVQESASWIRDWVYPNNSVCNSHNGGNVMQWWGGFKIETPLDGANYGPITETATGYLHSQPVKLWVR